MLRLFKLWWHSRGLGSSNRAKYVAAVSALAKLHDHRAVDRLMPGLEHREAVLRQGVAIALGELGDVRAVKPLMHVVEADQDATVGAAAAKSLGRLGDKQAINVLVKALGVSDPDMRVSAAKALARLGETQWQDWVKGTEYDFSQLAESKERRAVEPLAEAVKNVKWNVRSAALEGLGRLGDREAILPLISMVNDEDQRVRLAAIGWLVKLGDRRAIETLVQSMRHKDPDTRIAAVRAMGEWGERRTILELRKHMEDDDDRVCHAVVETLTRLGDVGGETPPGRASGSASIQAQPSPSALPDHAAPGRQTAGVSSVPARQPAAAPSSQPVLRSSSATPLPKPAGAAPRPQTGPAGPAQRPVTGVIRIPPKTPARSTPPEGTGSPPK